MAEYTEKWTVEYYVTSGLDPEIAGILFKKGWTIVGPAKAIKVLEIPDRTAICDLNYIARTAFLNDAELYSTAATMSAFARIRIFKTEWY